MWLKLSDDPPHAFTQLTLFHLLFAGTALLYMLVGEVELAGGVLRSGTGLVDLGSAQWIVRVAFVLYLAYFTFFVLILMRERKIIASLMKLRRQETNLVVVRALRSVAIFRATHYSSPGIAGLVLFLMSGERLDLYVPCAISVVAMFMARPSRRHWVAVFEQAARDYPGVSASPW